MVPLGSLGNKVPVGIFSLVTLFLTVISSGTYVDYYWEPSFPATNS
jgi:hypothetical protein